MDVIWDSAKADINLQKHGVSFEEAATVIQSAMTVTVEELSRKKIEERYGYTYP